MVVVTGGHRSGPDLPASSQHCQVSMDFMQAGKDVVCEKLRRLPRGSRPDESHAEQTGRLLSVISQNRYKNDLFKVKRLLTELQGLGRALMVRVNSMWYRGSNYYDLCGEERGRTRRRVHLELFGPPDRSAQSPGGKPLSVLFGVR